VETKEDAYAVGEQFKELLVELALAYKDAMPKLDGSENRRVQTEYIDKTIETVQKQIRPNAHGSLPLLDPESRRERVFEGEYKRLWGRVMALYVENCKNSHPTMAGLLGTSAYSSIARDFEAGLHKEVQDTTIPILDRHAAPGDDLYLFVLACMRSLDTKATVESLGNSEKTPPQLSEAFFGMFGLLMQARRAEREQDMTLAISYLFDANHLIGLHEGALYPMRHLPAVVETMHARRNAEKSHVKKKRAKARALELYYALRPRDAEGGPAAWTSAEEAMKEVWGALVKEAISAGRKDPIIKDSTVQEVCNLLHRQDKKGKGYDIRVEVIKHLPDGTDVKIPI
jgi:hypothetical protein